MIFYNGRRIGIMAGFLFGLIYLFVGLWKTTVFFLIVLSGFLIGQEVDRRRKWKQELQERNHN